MSLSAPLAAQGSADAAQFFAPRPAYRLLDGGRALLNFFLKATPVNPVEIEILDSHGALVRKLAPTPAQAGLNRVSWDLRTHRRVW